jgi:3-phosphoshikimate 1-carboxyvinyltransferase
LDSIELRSTKIFKGTFSPSPDKSISHRSIIFSSLAQGKSTIRNFLRADDPMRTLLAFRALGVDIDDTQDNIIVNGTGIHGLKQPKNEIDCGNSGTTIRLLSGVLSGNPFFSVLTGDESLRTRPMGRIIVPLQKMGADIQARGGNNRPPLAITGKTLQAITYTLPIASAQVKSAILLAGLYAEGETKITEPTKSRDHTERMLRAFGSKITVDGLHVTIKSGVELKGTDIEVPGDFSSAAFFIAGASLIDNSDITIKGVGINPTRTGLISALKEMGATIDISDTRTVSGEPIADIQCCGGKALKAVQITKEKIPALIDEFPILCVAATQAEGTTIIKGAEELRVKESDRIKSMATELKKMGAEIEEFQDGLSIKGKCKLRGTIVESHRDHRVAMALSIAGLLAHGTTTIQGVSSVKISFPGFFEVLRRLIS